MPIPDPGGAPGAAGPPWWNIWTLASPLAGEIVAHTIQSATPPVQGGQWHGTQIYTVNGPYATKADALKALGQNQGPAPGSTGPQDTPPGGSALAGAAGVASFLGRLAQASTWIRVGQAVLGLILIAVGLARITHAVPVATTIANVAAKGAVLA